MTLAEILYQLPAPIAAYLENSLERVSTSTEPTPEDVLYGALQATNWTKAECEAKLPEEIDAIFSLLDQVPLAVTKELFPEYSPGA